MSEKKYEVLDDQGFVIASDMLLPMAFCFIEGYASRYPNTKLNLTIKEMSYNADC